MTPIAPEAPEGQTALAALKTKTLKINLTPDQAAAVKTAAHKHELSQSEYCRFQILGQTSYKLPDATKLEAICRQLSGIGTNLNQCQEAINEAKDDGTLNGNQFDAMYKAIAEGRRLWLDPLDELKAELAKLKPAK